MKKLILIIVFILFLLPIFSQIIISDTTRSYNHTELKKIAKKIAKGIYCDSVLVISNDQLQIDSLLINNLNKEIINVNKENNLRNSIIVGKIKDLEVVQTENQILTDKIKWIKFGSAIVGVLILAEHILIALILGN